MAHDSRPNPGGQESVQKMRFRAAPARERIAPAGRLWTWQDRRNARRRVLSLVELVVHADAEDVGVAGIAATADGDRPGIERVAHGPADGVGTDGGRAEVSGVDENVLGLDRPLGRQLVFDTAAERPSSARAGVAVGGEGRRLKRQAGGGVAQGRRAGAVAKMPPPVK